jgi:hypothetical protein
MSASPKSSSKSAGGALLTLDPPETLTFTRTSLVTLPHPLGSIYKIRSRSEFPVVFIDCICYLGTVRHYRKTPPFPSLRSSLSNKTRYNSTSPRGTLHAELMMGEGDLSCATLTGHDSLRFLHIVLFLSLFLPHTNPLHPWRSSRSPHHPRRIDYFVHYKTPFTYPELPVRPTHSPYLVLFNCAVTADESLTPKCMLRLSNTSNAKVAFKVKTTHRHRYLVRPNQALLESGQSTEIEGIISVSSLFYSRLFVVS